VLTFQQYTGAVMAKAVEDTTFYVYNRFVALNEVGGEPAAFGGSVAMFHAKNARRQATMPHSLVATSTHDTKFGEDARARLYVLSEMAGEWADWVREWREMNRRHKTHVEGRPAPDANEEYRLYQTLMACWPVEPAGETEPFKPDEAFRQRLRDHVRKAVNEAKVNTHWVHPNEAWMEACDRFVNALLTPGDENAFLASFEGRARRIAHRGMVNSLAQVVLKITSPGVPDFYQGGEGWNFTLVDPDNRALIDWHEREVFKERICGTPWRDLLRGWKDGAIKVRLTSALLTFRREHVTLFQRGGYEPLTATGHFADRLVMFARRHEQKAVVVIVPRLTAMLGCPPLGLVWEDTAVTLPAVRGKWRDVFTGREWGGGTSAAMAEVLGELPVAVLATG
jgi:(1->4)-alpha-D-glucan 1-alpha-D-glucosylmutase